MLLAPIGLVVLWLSWQRRSPRVLLTATALITLAVRCHGRLVVLA